MTFHNAAPLGHAGASSARYARALTNLVRRGNATLVPAQQETPAIQPHARRAFEAFRRFRSLASMADFASACVELASSG
jgi:hypothetical protein